MNLLRLAWRQLRQHPGYSLGVILTLGLGFAVVAAMASAFYGVAAKPLHYPAGERLLWLSSQDTVRQLPPGMLSGAEANAGLAPSQTLEAFGSFYWNGATYIGTEGTPRVLTGANVGGEFFEVFGLQPVLGRVLRPDDSSDKMVLGHQAWLDLTGGDPEVVGRTLKFEGFSAEVVGVMPPAFDVPARGLAFWSPIDVAAARQNTTLFEQARFYAGVARARPGVSLAQVNAELKARSRTLATAHPGSHASWSLRAEDWKQRLVGGVQPVLLALLLVGALVLLIAVGNTVNLMVARGLARLGEWTVRQALGASQRRLHRQLLVETLLLVSLAFALGLALAWSGLKLWIGLGDSGLPRAAEVGLDPPVVGSLLGTGLLVALLASALTLLPLLRGIDLHQLRARGMGTSRLGWLGLVARLLPGLGVALSTAALGTAVVVALSVDRLGQVTLGFTTAPVAVAHGFVAGGPEQVDAQRAFATQLLESARRSGASRVALMSSPPLSGIGFIPVDVQRVGSDQNLPQQPILRTVQGDPLALLDIPLLAGRALAATDRAGAPQVAMVSRAFALAAFGREAPLGERVRIPPFGTSGELLEFEIVGVFGDVRSRAAAAEFQQEIWLPYGQYTTNSIALLGGGGLPAAALVKPLQEAIWRVDPRQGVYRAYTLDDELGRELATPRFFARNAGGFALLALLLGTIGIYGVVAFDLARRQRDLALRAALGAGSRQLSGWIVGQGLRTLLLGLTLGAALGWMLIALVRHQLFGVADAGTGALTAAALLVAAATLTVCWWLGRQAGRTDPMLALRHD